MNSLAQAALVVRDFTQRAERFDVLGRFLETRLRAAAELIDLVEAVEVDAALRDDGATVANEVSKWAAVPRGGAPSNPAVRHGDGDHLGRGERQVILTLAQEPGAAG
jgi:hypothetical protein